MSNDSDFKSRIVIEDGFSETLNKFERETKQAANQTGSLKKALNSITGTHKTEFKAVGMNSVQSAVKQVQGQLERLTNKPVNITGKAKITRDDITKAKAQVKELKAQLKDLTGQDYDIDIDIGGTSLNSTSLSSKLKSSLSGAASVAAGNLIAMGTAALGSAVTSGVSSAVTSGSERQQYRTNMTYFLGDSDKANTMMKWASSNAAATQFSSSEVMAATSRAIQFSSDTDEAKRFVQLAEDMASLTPGKTINDAIEALADAQMGEFERMKEFGFKGSADAYEEAGNDFWKMANASNGKTIEEQFSGGTAAGLTSAAAKWGTITGNFEDIIGDLGEKMLNGLAPQLDWLIEKSEALSGVFGDKLEAAGLLVWGNLCAIKEALEPYLPMLSSIASIVGTVLGSTLRAIGAVLGGAILPAIKWIGEKLQPAFEWLTGEAEDIAEAFDWLNDKIDYAAEHMKELPGKIAQYLKEGLGNLGSLIKSALGFGSSDTTTTTTGTTTDSGGFSGSSSSGSGAKTKNLSSSGSIVNSIFKNATGTAAFSGGWTQMNENMKGEIVKLPNGSKIYPHETTKRMLKNELKSGNTSNSVYNISIDARGSNLSKSDQYRLRKEIVRDLVDALGNVVPA